MEDIDNIESELSWIHTMMWDTFNKLPNGEPKEHLLKAIEGVEKCEGSIENHKKNEDNT